MGQELKNPLNPHLECYPTATHLVYFSVLGVKVSGNHLALSHLLSSVLYPIRGQCPSGGTAELFIPQTHVLSQAHTEAAFENNSQTPTTMLTVLVGTVLPLNPFGFAVHGEALTFSPTLARGNKFL